VPQGLPAADAYEAQQQQQQRKLGEQQQPTDAAAAAVAPLPDVQPALGGLQESAKQPAAVGEVVAPEEAVAYIADDAATTAAAIAPLPDVPVRADVAAAVLGSAVNAAAPHCCCSCVLRPSSAGQQLQLQVLVVADVPIVLAAGAKQRMTAGPHGQAGGAPVGPGGVRWWGLRQHQSERGRCCSRLGSRRQ
jgi:hypothetical protein